VWKKKKRRRRRRRKKKTMKENIMKMKWLYSSRNSASSLREEGLTRDKGKRSQDKRGYVTIIARMSISMPNAHMRERSKIMTRERSLTKATRKIINILRRSLMVKLMLAKNRTQVMRVLNQKVMT
jgi:hypothetical protein